MIVRLTHRVTLDHLRAMNFWDLVDMRGAKECWTLKSQKVVSYPVVKISPRITGIGIWVSLNAHRVALALHRNEALPAELTVDHLCFNVSCVNPRHLDLVTQAENVRRRRCAHNPTSTHLTPSNTTSSKVAACL